MAIYGGRMTTSPRQIADRIETARRVEGLPVTALAEEAGIAEKTLRRRLSAPDKFSLAELAAVARVLKRTLEWLLTGDDQQAEVPA